MNHFWCFGGREYPFDISESDCMKKVGDALTTLKKLADELENKAACANLAPHETIDEQCGMIGTFFDMIFGGGEGKKICGERHSLDRYSEAYMEFIVFLNSQVEEFSAMRESIEKRYAERLAAVVGGNI